MAAMSGTVLLRRCTVRNCHKNGVEACMGGSLQAEDVTSHNNLQGCLVRDAAGPVRLTQVGVVGRALGIAGLAKRCGAHSLPSLPPACLQLLLLIPLPSSLTSVAQCTFFNNQHEGVTMASNKSSELLLRSCQVSAAVQQPAEWNAGSYLPPALPAGAPVCMQ